mmetsp:Transcript_97866/g.282373  ORF Transcript_97866/g.282373 Transcript_97866/m.282373 type:complete len:259 (-) Transcript_97866:126-902(-)
MATRAFKPAVQIVPYSIKNTFITVEVPEAEPLKLATRSLSHGSLATMWASQSSAVGGGSDSVDFAELAADDDAVDEDPVGEVAVEQRVADEAAAFENAEPETASKWKSRAGVARTVDSSLAFDSPQRALHAGQTREVRRGYWQQTPPTDVSQGPQTKSRGRPPKGVRMRIKAALWEKQMYGGGSRIGDGQELSTVARNYLERLMRGPIVGMEMAHAEQEAFAAASSSTCMPQRVHGRAGSRRQPFCTSQGLSRVSPSR